MFGEAVGLAVTDVDVVGVGLSDAVRLAVAVVEPLGVAVELPLEVSDADAVGVGLGNKLLQAACYLTMACAWWRRF